MAKPEWRDSPFDHLGLIRISGFGFRIYEIQPSFTPKLGNIPSRFTSTCGGTKLFDRFVSSRFNLEPKNAAVLARQHSAEKP